MTRKEALWNKQNTALRHPSDVFGSAYDAAGITPDTLKYKPDEGFCELLHRLNLTLFISREYENMLIALSPVKGGKLSQSFIHLPHPSGIAVDAQTNTMYVAATRNPNQIIEFKSTTSYLKRLKTAKPSLNCMLPSRAKYYPGEYYFHDLVFGNGQLYANSVGMNSIIKVDMNNAKPEAPAWWPLCVEKNEQPVTSANYIQLNSIAFGGDLEQSFFSASGAKISSRRPGHLNYPVDKQGVIFSGASRQPVGFGLTRPHAARLHNGKIWVANSGYGEVGYIENEQFQPVFKLDGWTRGLCFAGDVLFVGVSRILPRFRHYAPGITTNAQNCSVAALDLKKGTIIGEVSFPFGNQIFAIEHLPAAVVRGLPFKTLQQPVTEKKIFSVSLF